MATSSAWCVCMVEYYNPFPVTVLYKDNSEKLFKCDFTAEFLKAHSEFVLCDYGFVCHENPLFLGDDLTWLLLERG